MAEKTNAQINEENTTTINALGSYLDYVAPTEQFGSNALGRIGNIKPIQSQEDLVERGLIGADGLMTPQGDLFKTLIDGGLVNPDGTLSKTSTAYMMDDDDALRPENLEYWQIRRDNKIGEKPITWKETFGSLGELLYDAGAGLGTMVKLGLKNMNQQDPEDVIQNMKATGIQVDEEKIRATLQTEKDALLNRSSVAATSFLENSAKAFAETGAMIDLGASWAASLPEKIMGDDAKASEIVDSARQFQDRLIKSNQDAVIGSTLDAALQTVTYVPEMARVKDELPKAEFDKIIKQTGAAGQIFADPFEMAQVGTIMKLASRPITSRIALNAERIIGQTSQRAARLAEINVEIADVERAKGMAQNAADLAMKTANAARERFDLDGDQNLLRRANAAEDIFNGSTAQVSRFTDDGIRLADEAAQITAQSEKLASKIPLAAAQAFEATAKAGRDLKAMPFNTFAAIVEPVGRGLIALDDGLNAASKKLGIDGAYNILTSKVGQAVGYGAAVGLGPVPAALGAAGSVLKSGPFLQRLADTSRILGTEMAKAQSQIPFFQRVANNSMISPAHRSLAHLSDLATLGGFLPDIARRAARGTALSFPADFAAQYMSDGGEINQNTFKQAFAESLLIGGSSAALGGMFAGSKQRHRELAVGDEINFRNEITAPDQKRLFTQAPSGVRRAVGTFSAVFPSVNIQFTESGGGFHDDNTIGIDLNSSNPLKYLLAHEVKHLLVHRNQMHTPIVAMMLGDGETGGIMRSPDGTLNPEFEAFAKEYNNRQIAAGRQPVSLGKIAEEFFVEAGVEDMARITESGELGAMASRTEARRMVGRLFNSIFDKSTVLKDFHLRIGGLMDQGGKLVQGNGLLDPGITQTQEMRNLTKNMLSRAAGRSVGQFEPLGSANVGNKGEGPGINLPINPGDNAMIEKIGPVEFEMETVNGQRRVVRDSAGNPVPIDFNTQLMRSRTGSLIQEAIGNRPSTYQAQPGEMHLNDEGIWEGHLPPDIIEHIKKKGSLNQDQIRMVEHVNSMIKNFKGDVALVINHPATSRNKKGKLNYKTLKATLRQVVPISWNLTKDGNLMLGLMSVTQLKANVDTRISSKMGQKLYQGNRAKLMVDIGKVMELHQKGQRTDSYFDTQYGAAKSQQYKNFVNSVFGLITKKQGEANPIFSEENLRGNGVYKTYRADRISQATKMTGDRYPFQYDFVVQNMMPNGMPTLDEQGRPVAQNLLPEPTAEKEVASPENQGREGQATNGTEQANLQTQPGSTSTGGPTPEGAGLREQGGLPRSPEQFQSSDRPGDTGIPLEGLPATVTIKGLGKVTFGPSEVSRQVAADYAKSVGIDYNPLRQYAKVDEARAKRIADEYEKMPHAPNDPKVKASYDAMIKETLAQWEAIKKTGLKVEAIPAGMNDPYAVSPRLALLDVKDNNHLWFFPTENGFGGSESAGVDISGNPLMTPTGEVLNGHKMLANDVFRIVHDYFGHIKEGVGFRADGEENAWRSHSAMYSDLARPAMTAETRGQNSWVNFGPFGEFNKTASGSETQYAPQKTGIMPDWVMNEGASDVNRLPEPVNPAAPNVPFKKPISAPAANIGKEMQLMNQTSVGGNPDMIMSAKWGRTESEINPETGKKQAAQTSAIVANSKNPEDHQVGFRRIEALLNAPDLKPAQKKALEDFVVKTAGFAVDSPGFRDIPVAKTLEEAKNVIAKVKDRMAKNLLSIYDAVPTPVKNYWQRWYPLAYEWNNAQSKVHTLPAPAIAGINARLSPGKDWIHNVNMTERILSAFTGKISMTPEIAKGAAPLLDDALESKFNSKENKNRSQEWRQEQIDKNNQAKKEINAMIGMNIEDMTSKQAARLIRFHTQVLGENRVFNYFEKGNPVYADAISWQSFVNLEKAINIYRDPSIESISLNMGDDHKIRSFYNNQIAPHDPTLRDVTSDTHAVAAAYLLPLKQNSLQVLRNFGTTSNSVAGMSGMYYIVADAYRKAADARGVEPRAMQSITWEGVRSMFPRGFKKPENIKKVEEIWSRVESKKITKQQALQEINGLMVDFFSKNPDSRPRVTVLPTQ